MRPCTAALVLLGLLAAGAAAEDSAELLAALRVQWKSQSTEHKLTELEKLELVADGAVLEQSLLWLKGADPAVAGGLIRLIGACARRDRLRPQAEKAVRDYLARHLTQRQKKEDREFKQILRKHGSKLPPGNRMAAGPDWRDPYDERKRQIPKEILEERALLKIIAAVVVREKLCGALAQLGRAFQEHHDPQVLVYLAEAFGSLQEWRALPDMADVLRIQFHGRMVSGGAVIGADSWRKMRLKWDVHKDRVWWSRPEYVMRVRRPILEAFRKMTGQEVLSAREVDRWLLTHEAELQRHGVKLDGAFKARARASRG